MKPRRVILDEAKTLPPASITSRIVLVCPECGFTDTMRGRSDGGHCTSCGYHMDGDGWNEFVREASGKMIGDALQWASYLKKLEGGP